MKLRKLFRDACVICMFYVASMANGAPLYEYELIGAGWCTGPDMYGNTPRSYPFSNIVFPRSAAGCATHCNAQGSTYLSGFIRHDWGTCSCLYVANDPSAGSYLGGNSVLFTAVGAVDDSTSSSGGSCYARRGFVPMPTAPPLVIDDYTDRGPGWCMGIAEGGTENVNFDYFYKYIAAAGGTTEERAQSCGTYCIDNTPPKYLQYHIGMHHSFSSSITYNNCYCLFIDGHLPPIPSGAEYYTAGTSIGDLNVYSPNTDYHCWAHNNYDTTPRIRLFATLPGGINLDMCEAFAENSGDETLTCSASIDIPFVDGQLKVAIEDGECIDNGPDTASGATGVNTNIGVDAITEVVVSAADISSGTDNENGTRSVVKHHCFRADFYPTGVDGSTSDWSVLAKKWNVTSTFTYNMDGDFEVEVVTDAFTPSSTSDSESRAVEVFANDNACGITGSDGPYSINSVMTVCAWVDDSDVIIYGVKNVKMQLQDSDHEVIVVDEASSPSFVTSLSDGTAKTFEIKTLLLPEIFDEFGGNSGSVIFVGTCLLTYTNGRRLSGNKRILEKKEEVPFSLEIQVEAGGDAPKIAQLDVESGSHQLGVGIAAFGVGMAAMI